MRDIGYTNFNLIPYIRLDIQRIPIGYPARYPVRYWIIIQIQAGQSAGYPAGYLISKFQLDIQYPNFSWIFNTQIPAGYSISKSQLDSVNIQIPAGYWISRYSAIYPDGYSARYLDFQIPVRYLAGYLSRYWISKSQLDIRYPNSSQISSQMSFCFVYYNCMSFYVFFV